jgi:ribosome modulation factor
MSYQDPPRRRRMSRYPAFAQYEDGYPSYQDTQADYSSGSGHRDGYRGFEGLAGAPRELAPWDDPAQQSAWDTGAQRSVRDTSTQQAAWDEPAEWEPARRRSGSFRVLSDDDYGRPSGTGHGGQRSGRGLLAGAVAGFLAAAVALGVANLIAAFVRPQASPIIAVGEAFIDRTPPALKNFAVQKFGENDKNMLLLGMYVTIALLAIVIGMLAWRRVSIGVAGIGLFGLFGAFVAITRPESRVSDMIPAIVGGIAGIAALIWLVRMGASGHRGHLGHRGHRRRQGPSTALDGQGVIRSGPA